MIFYFLCCSLAQTQRHECHYSGEYRTLFLMMASLKKAGRQTAHLPLMALVSSPLSAAAGHVHLPPLVLLMILRHHTQWEASLSAFKVWFSSSPFVSSLLWNHCFEYHFIANFKPTFFHFNIQEEENWKFPCSYLRGNFGNVLRSIIPNCDLMQRVDKHLTGQCFTH